jgi:hypothetical protein
MSKKPDDAAPPAFDDVLKRMLQTPPQPKVTAKPKQKSKKKKAT